MCHFVLVFFSPFSIVITLLTEERANLSAFRTFVRFVLVWICRFPLPLNVWEGLRFVIVSLPGLFSYLVFTLCCFVVYSTRRFVLCLALCYFVLVFFCPFSIAITSFGEERGNLGAFRTFVRFALVWFCLFPLPLGAWEGGGCSFCLWHPWTFLLPFFRILSVSISEFLEQPSYAFSVMWLLNTNPAVGETLRFSSIALNEKDVYNAYTGEYTVPVNGTYLFTSNLCTHANRWVNIKFMAGSAVIGAFRAADHDWDFCSSSSVISYLTKDTKVKMNVQSKAPSEIFYNAQNNYLSSFSGYLI